MGCYATGVTVVTARAPDGEPVGLTANSFTSVSLDPPLLLVCPALSAATTQVLLKAEHFAVNILSDYLGLLQSAQTVANNVDNLERRRATATENELLGQAGRISRRTIGVTQRMYSPKASP